MHSWADTVLPRMLFFWWLSAPLRDTIVSRHSNATPCTTSCSCLHHHCVYNCFQTSATCKDACRNACISRYVTWIINPTVGCHYFPPGLLTSATLKKAATNFAAWWTEAQWVWTVRLRLLPDSVATAMWTRAFCVWVQHANHSATEPPPSTLPSDVIFHNLTRHRLSVATVQWVTTLIIQHACDLWTTYNL